MGFLRRTVRCFGPRCGEVSAFTFAAGRRSGQRLQEMNGRGREPDMELNPIVGQGSRRALSPLVNLINVPLSCVRCIIPLQCTTSARLHCSRDHCV